MTDPSETAAPAGTDPVHLERTVDSFEEAWQRGGRPDLDDYLPAGPGRLAALVELVHVDLEYRLKAGEQARVEDYLRRYPELAGERDELLELLAAEYRLRRRREPLVHLAEYAGRFPGHHADLVACCGAEATPAQAPGATPFDPEATGPPTAPKPREHPPGGAPGLAVVTGSRYRVLGLHARGGLGEILVAADEQLHREVALKLLQPAHAHQPDSRARFLREAEITSQLEHPGVVPVYGLGQLGDGTPVYAMRFVRGGTLQDAVSRFHQAGGPPTDPRERRLAFHHLLSRFVAVCNAVAYAHSRGVLHRDLKPGNIMLGEYGETLVVDWGLARPFGADTPAGEGKATAAGQTQVGVVVGTPAFMPPEQAAGRPDLSGPAVDIYALGATLYMLLTGQPPFRDALIHDLLDKVCRSEFPAPRAVKKDVPPALEAVCLKAMAAKPQDRYGSALDLARDLEHWLADEPVSAWPEPVRVPARRWLSRNSTLAATAAVALLATAGLAVVTSVLTAAREREESARKEEESARKEEAAARKLAELRSDQDRQRLDEADRTAYRHLIAEANRAWWASDLGGAARRLDKCKPELRQWEWHHLRRRCESDLLTLRGHQLSVWAVCFRPDGRRLASASVDGTVRVWDAGTGREILCLDKHRGYVWGLAYSPDGRRLASGGADGAIKIWDGGKEARTFDVPGWEVLGLAFHPDGRHLAAACGRLRKPGENPQPGCVRVWDAASGREVLVLKGHTQPVRAVAFRRGGRQLASASEDGTVRVWDVGGWAGRWREALILRGHTDFVYGVAYSPDGRRLASASADRTVRVWDAATGKEVHTLGGHTGWVWGVAFSPDGTRLASSSDDRTIKVWDATLGRSLFSLRGHTQGIAGVCFSPDGKRLASASDDGTVKVWDATGRKAWRTLCGHTRAVWGAAFSPDGQRVATSSDDCTIRVWDPVTGRVVLTMTAAAGSARVAFNPDGTLLASVHDDGAVKVWDAHSGAVRFTLEGHTDKAWDVAFSPDGKMLATAGHDKTVRLWDVATGKALRVLRRHADKVWAVAFSPDGKRLASGGGDRAVQLWDPATGRKLRTLAGHGSAVLALAFSPDGRQLAVGTADIDRVITSDPGEVRLWDLPGRREPLTLHGHLRAVTALAFRPDGRRLVSAGTDGTLRVWDPATGQEVLALHGHGGPVNGMAISPDGMRLASAGGDGNAIVWEGTPE